MRTRAAIRYSLLVLTAAALVTGPGWAERGDDSKRKSKNGRTEGEIEGVEVVVEYGRPSVRGREVWGALVPYGKIWRTGSDEATTIRFSGDVLVEGERLAAGTYGLFTIPTAGEWTVVFSRTWDTWGAYDYEESQDALRVTVSPRPAEPVESLEFQVQGGEVVLRWAGLEVAFAVAPAT